MNKEIEIGEYVRTKTGKIFKITTYDETQNKYHSVTELVWNIIFPREITKHSKNIIDLIEVGDYVNRYKVLEIRRNENRILIGVYKDTETVIYKTLTNENVKSIVTHQQFKEMEYKVD